MAKKDLVLFDDIPNPYLGTILKIIVQDEGGWVLHCNNPNDNDGGWTFAGVTRTLYKQVLGSDRTPQEIQNFLKVARRELERNIYVIYYNEFVKPLTYFEYADDYIVSAAVNVGMDDVNKWIDNLQGRTFNEQYTFKQVFLDRWQEHYVQLVVKNAEAWRAWAHYLEVCKEVENYNKYKDHMEPRKEVAITGVKPKYFRAIYLSGWLNRVDRYRY